LFAYPVLQAADILIVRANSVPVGQDQKQHIEVTRDIAEYFNTSYGEFFTLPEPFIPESVATVPGRDGRKMSKSYNNAIELFAPEKQARQQIYSIVTDSASVEDSKDPDNSILYSILKLFCDSAEQATWADRFRNGGLGYGEVKKEIFGRFMDTFGPMRRHRQELEKEPEYLDAILRDGVAKVKEIAVPLVKAARDAVGIPNH
jgi:tryptophanyl-tRNA synthetase